MDHIMAGADLSALNSLARNGWANQRVRRQTPAQEEAPAKTMADILDKVQKSKATAPEAKSGQRLAKRGGCVIDVAIPVPTKAFGADRLVYPYDELAVDESFFVAAKKYGVRNDSPGKQFISRPWEQDGIKGRRVWRVK